MGEIIDIDNITRPSPHLFQLSPSRTSLEMSPTNSTDPECPSESAIVIDRMDMLDSVLLPIIAVLGIVGNLFSVAIFRQTRKLRRLASSVYLISLALSDSIFLFTLLLSMPALSLLEHRAACKTVFYFLNVSGVFSSWLVVIFTVERFIVIAYPLTRMARCSRSRAKYLLLFILPVPCIMYIYTAVVLIDVDPITLRCEPREEYVFTVTVLHSIEISLTYFIPAFTIVALNVCIGLKLVDSNMQRRELRSGSASSDVAASTIYDSILHDSTQFKHSFRSMRDRKASFRSQRSISVSSERRRSRVSTIGQSGTTNVNENAITRTLIVISTTFAFLNFPHNAVLLVKLCARLTSIGQCFARSDFMYVLTSICYALYYANFGVNIVVYHLTSSNYREGARALIGRMLWTVRARRTSRARMNSENGTRRRLGGSARDNAEKERKCDGGKRSLTPVTPRRTGTEEPALLRSITETENES